MRPSVYLYEDQRPHTDLHQSRAYQVTSDPRSFREFLDDLWLFHYSRSMKGRIVALKDVVYTISHVKAGCILPGERWQETVTALALCDGGGNYAASTRLDLFLCSGNREGCQVLMTAKGKWLLGMQWGKEKLLGFPPPLVHPYVVNHELDWIQCLNQARCNNP